MRKKIVIIGCTSILLLIATYIRRHFYPQPSLEIQYYYSAFVLSAIFFIIILSTVVLWQWGNNQKVGIVKNLRLYDKNRRNSYRIQYLSNTGPNLQVERNNHINRPYLLEIVNLSEKGSQIYHNGLIKIMDKINGHILFNNGDRVKISGKIIDISGSKASMQFDQSLPAALLIDEQRRMLSLKVKNKLKRKL
jgi:hypothetical protein